MARTPANGDFIASFTNEFYNRFIGLKLATQLIKISYFNIGADFDFVRKLLQSLFGPFWETFWSVVEFGWGSTDFLLGITGSPLTHSVSVSISISMVASSVDLVSKWEVDSLVSSNAIALCLSCLT